MRGLPEGLVVRIAGHNVGAAIGAPEGFPLLGLGLALGEQFPVGLGHLMVKGTAVRGAEDNPELPRGTHELPGKRFLGH